MNGRPFGKVNGLHKNGSCTCPIPSSCDRGKTSAGGATGFDCKDLWQCQYEDSGACERGPEIASLMNMGSCLHALLAQARSLNGTEGNRVRPVPLLPRSAGDAPTLVGASQSLALNEIFPNRLDCMLFKPRSEDFCCPIARLSAMCVMLGRVAWIGARSARCTRRARGSAGSASIAASYSTLV